MDGTRDRVTYQKLVTRSRYGLVRCAVGIWPSHQRDDTVRAGASVDVQRDTARPHLLSRYGVTLRGNVTSVDVQRDTSPPSAPLHTFSLLMFLS